MLLQALLLLDATSTTADDQQAAAAAAGMAVFFVVFGIFFLAVLAFQIYCYWRVAEKSGYQGAMSLLMLVPVVNFVILIIWVFSEWPIETELKRYRAQYGQLPPPPAQVQTPGIAPGASTLPPST